MNNKNILWLSLFLILLTVNVVDVVQIASDQGRVSWKDMIFGVFAFIGLLVTMIEIKRKKQKKKIED